MKKSIFPVFVFSLMVILVPACSPGGASQPTPEPPTRTPATEPSPTPVPPTATPEPTPTDDGLVEIELNNDTGDMVCAVIAYDFKVTGEAPNLIEGQVMMAGQTITVTLVEGEYDFEVWDCQMNTLNNLYEYTITDDFVWNLSEVPEDYTFEMQQSVILVNQRAWDICEFYIRPGDSEDWGENLFYPEQDYYLAAGSTLIEPIEPGLFDFKLVYCDGTIASTQMDLVVPEDQNMEWTLTP